MSKKLTNKTADFFCGGSGATLQSFPKTYKFHSNSVALVSRIIGNAFPPEYAKQIGLAIIKNTNGTI